MLLVTGIDPGLVHTGVVSLAFLPRSKAIMRHHMTFTSLSKPENMKRFVETTTDRLGTVFIEKYRPRSHFSSDEKMGLLVEQIHSAHPGSKIIDNTGSKKVIRPALLQLLNLTDFPTTHHQDLQAAARILVYGMLKNLELNAVLTDVVIDAVNGQPWECIEAKGEFK